LHTRLLGLGNLDSGKEGDVLMPNW
jgi:hypothetical protein